MHLSPHQSSAPQNNAEHYAQLHNLRQPLAHFGLEYQDPYASMPFNAETKSHIGSLGSRYAMASQLPDAPQTGALKYAIENQMNDYYRRHLVPQAYAPLPGTAQAFDQQLATMNDPLKDDQMREFLRQYDPNHKSSHLTEKNGKYAVDARRVRKELDRMNLFNKKSPTVTSNEELQAMGQYKDVLQQTLNADPQSTAFEYAARPPTASTSLPFEAVKGFGKGILATVTTALFGVSLIAGKGAIDFPTILYGGLSLATWGMLKKGSPVNKFIASDVYANLYNQNPQAVPHVIEQLQGERVHGLVKKLRKNPTEQNKQKFIGALAQDGTIDQTTHTVLQGLRPTDVGTVVGIAHEAKTGTHSTDFQKVFENGVNPQLAKQMAVLS